MAKKSTITSEVIRLTPKRASQLLETNVNHQRHLSRGRVETYAREIIDGRFPMTGQPIVINSDGEMIDGQHRCAAVLMAKKEIPEILLVKGITNSAFIHLDTGKQRSAADVLGINGYKNVNSLAAITRVSLSYRLDGEMRQRFKHRISNAEILKEVDSDERYNSTNTFFVKLNPFARPLGLGSSLPGLQMILLKKRAPLEEIQNFCDKVLYGESLKKDHPIHQLRQALFDAAASPTFRIQARTRDARLIKTWNAYFRGESGRTITKWNALRDEYPKIISKYR